MPPSGSGAAITHLQGDRARLRILEKGGKEKQVWLDREAESDLDAWLEASAIIEPGATLFHTLDKGHKLTGVGISSRDMLRVVKHRCKAAGLSETFCNHTFRGRASRYS